MSRLQWNGVAAPDFSTSLAGIRTAGSMLDQAFQTAGSTIEGVDNDISSRVNKAVMAQLAGISESEGAEARIQEMFGSVDPRRLSVETLQFGAGRPDALIDRETGRFDMAVKKREDGVMLDNRERTEEAEPAARRYQLAQLNNDEAGMKEALAELVSSRLRSSQLAGIVQSGQDLRTGAQGIRSADQSFDISKWNFGNTKEDRALAEQTAGIVAQARRMGTVQDAMTFINSQQGVDPRVINAAMAGIGAPGLVDLNTFTGGGPGGGSLDTAGGTGTSGGMGIVNYEAKARGFASVPESVKSLGDLDSWGTTVLAGSDGTFSSASGPYQITRNTFREFAKTALGDNWKSLPNSFENHDKVAKAIFDSAKGSNAAMRGRWAAFKNMSDGDLNAVRAAGWEDARQVIARIESNTDPRQLALDSVADDLALDNASDAVGSPVTEGYYAAQGKPRRGVIAVAGEITAKGAWGEGLDKTLVEKRLRDVAAKSKEIAEELGLKNWNPNEDQLAVLLKESLVGRGWFANFSGRDRSVADLFSTTDLGDRQIDEDMLKANIQEIQSGTGEGAILKKEDIALAQREKAALTMQVQQKQALITRLQNSGTDPQIVARYQSELVILQEQLNGVPGRNASQGRGSLFTGGQEAPGKQTPTKPAAKALPKVARPAARMSFDEALRVKVGPKFDPNKDTIAKRVSDAFTGFFK